MPSRTKKRDFAAVVKVFDGGTGNGVVEVYKLSAGPAGAAAQKARFRAARSQYSVWKGHERKIWQNRGSPAFHIWSNHLLSRNRTGNGPEWERSSLWWNILDPNTVSIFRLLLLRRTWLTGGSGNA